VGREGRYLKQMSRTCGTCSLCCRVMSVPEMKPDHAWCPKCTLGTGCSIYASRPERCHDFSCQWLKDDRFGDHWFPKTAKIIVDHRVEGLTAVVSFVVDPAYPTRWREEPWFSDIKQIAKSGIAGFRGIKWTTIVLVRNQRTVIGR
jgi:hypothetical protein